MARFNTIEHLPDRKHCMAECSFLDFVRRIFKKRYEGWIEFSWGHIAIEKPDLYYSQFLEDIGSNEEFPF